MDGNDFDENEIEEIESSNGYSFPGFGTGNYYKENDININSSNNNIISPSQNISQSTNQSNIPVSSSENSGVQQSSPSPNASSSGNSIGSPANNNDGAPVVSGKSNINSNQRNTNNNTSTNANNSSSNTSNNVNTTKNKNIPDNNKGLKSSDNSGTGSNNKSNINTGRGGGFKNAVKNFGSRFFNGATSSAKTMETSMQGEDAPEKDEVGNTLSGIGKGVGNFTNLLLLLGGAKVVVIIISILLVIIFLVTVVSALIPVIQGAVFGGTKFTGWKCNMYSPVSNANPGEVSSFYTWRIWNGAPDAHTGIDISYDSKGEEILATHDGWVVETNYERDGATGEPFGVYIKIEDPKETDDEKKYRTYYAHICSLEEERELKKSCEAGNYTGCDDKCEEYIKPDGTIGHRYIWSCGESEEEFENLIGNLRVGATVEKNDVIGYVSDTGSRSKACDFHFHFETQADDLNDKPDEGYVPESPNRYFNIEKESTGCDPVLNNEYDPPTINEIIDWECEKYELVVEPDDDEELNDEIFQYCDLEEPITPEEYRYKGDINIKLSQSTIAGEYVPEEGIGTYSAEVCGYQANPSYFGKDNIGCAAGVRNYLESFLPDDAFGKIETWRNEGYIHAADYWYGNRIILGENGFASDQTISAGSMWVSSYSKDWDCYEKDDCGHIMFITEYDEATQMATVYECNGGAKDSTGKANNGICGYYTYSKSNLENRTGFLGYIHVLNEEDC